MKKTVLVFGLIGGVVISALMLGSIPFAKKIGFDKSQFVGYTVMVLSFLMVFFGIRSYRENIGTFRLVAPSQLALSSPSSPAFATC